MTKLRASDVFKLPDGFYADGNGLYLHVRYNGTSRAWVLEEHLMEDVCSEGSVQ